MIEYRVGNLLESEAQALVNTVNTHGVMGKGVALQFKKLFPHNYKLYAKACKEQQVKIGELFVTEDESLLTGKKIIINFPTKTDWRKPSEYAYIESGLRRLADLIHLEHLASVAIPPLGSGNGGLDWSRVKQLMEKHLSALDCHIIVYEPSTIILEALKKERVKLTPARAMLLAVLYDLVRNGEFVSEFSAEKVAYFLQRFGAKDAFKLEFEPRFYGPFSGKVKHVLYYLNGSYIMGYSTKDKKPFDELGLLLDGEKEVDAFLSRKQNQHFSEIADRTKKFLFGFYSSFGLELLSTIDFIITQKNVRTVKEIEENLWSDRKKELFAHPQFISIAVERIENHLTQKPN